MPLVSLGRGEWVFLAMVLSSASSSIFFLGRLYGTLLRQLLPNLSSPAAYALVGAASLAAGTTRTISVSRALSSLIPPSSTRVCIEVSARVWMHRGLGGMPGQDRACGGLHRHSRRKAPHRDAR